MVARDDIKYIAPHPPSPPPPPPPPPPQTKKMLRIP